VLVDPLVPDDEAERFYGALDKDVERRGLPVRVLLTAPHHRRSADAVAARYDGRVWDGDGELPAGVETFAVAHPKPVERPVWLAPLRTLVFGDALTTLGGELQVWWDLRWENGEAWYRERLLPSLEPLRELPVEHVIVGHGPPARGEELARALARPPYA
jgi:hypothetical protein